MIEMRLTVGSMEWGMFTRLWRPMGAAARAPPIRKPAWRRGPMRQGRLLPCHAEKVQYSRDEHVQTALKLGKRELQKVMVLTLRDKGLLGRVCLMAMLGVRDFVRALGFVRVRVMEMQLEAVPQGRVYLMAVIGARDFVRDMDVTRVKVMEIQLEVFRRGVMSMLLRGLSVRKDVKATAHLNPCERMHTSCLLPGSLSCGHGRILPLEQGWKKAGQGSERSAVGHAADDGMDAAPPVAPVTVAADTQLSDGEQTQPGNDHGEASTTSATEVPAVSEREGLRQTDLKFWLK